MKVKSLSRVRLFATPWTVAYQVSPSIGLFRQEYQSGLPFPSPGYLPNAGIEPRSPALQADSLLSEPPGECWWMLADRICHQYLCSDFHCLVDFTHHQHSLRAPSLISSSVLGSSLLLSNFFFPCGQNYQGP